MGELRIAMYLIAGSACFLSGAMLPNKLLPKMKNRPAAILVAILVVPGIIEFGTVFVDNALFGTNRPIAQTLLVFGTLLGILGANFSATTQKNQSP